MNQTYLKLGAGFLGLTMLCSFTTVVRAAQVPLSIELQKASNEFKENTKKYPEYAKLPKKQVTFLWQWLAKKVKREPTTVQENKRARKIIGVIGIAAVTAISVIIFIIYRYKIPGVRNEHQNIPGITAEWSNLLAKQKDNTVPENKRPKPKDVIKF